MCGRTRGVKLGDMSPRLRFLSLRVENFIERYSASADMSRRIAEPNRKRGMSSTPDKEASSGVVPVAVSKVEAKEDKDLKEKVAVPEPVPNNIEPEYVLVTDGGDDGERMELPIDPTDNSIGLTTLSHAFPGAHGLKYKNPATGASRALMVDQSGTKFLPPPGGWGEKVFIAIFQTQSINHAPRAMGKHSVTFRSVGQIIDHDELRGDQSTKRRKIMDESDSSDTEIGRNGSASGLNTVKQKRIEDPGTQAPRAEEQRRCTDLIVLGLPYRTTLEQFKKYFEQFGIVVACELKRDESGTSKGFGFVQMDTYDAQLRVLSKPTHVIDGRKCQVRIPNSKTKEAQTVMNCKLFIGRVAKKTTPEDLRIFFTMEAQHILPECTVVDVFIPKPFRHFAFITLSHPSVARELIEIGDFVLDGVSMNVLAATPKEASGDMSPIPPRYTSPVCGAESPCRAGRNTSPSPSKMSCYHESPELYYQGPSCGKVGGSVTRNRYIGENRFSPGYMQLAPQRNRRAQLEQPGDSHRCMAGVLVNST
uniref:RRM domain-containing protein n=1 Tax=Steinernema glaseri TaxID=37863 RepID=A0A1I7ZFS5_9BILA